MIGVSDQNGRTYESKFGIYNKKDGFILSDYSKKLSMSDFANQLLHENCWSLKKNAKKMTKDEIEKELGYKIDIIDKHESSVYTRTTDFSTFLDEMYKLFSE